MIDVNGLVEGDLAPVAYEIDRACRISGFFGIRRHGVDPDLVTDLERVAREFFALSDAEKSEVSMGRGGSAWRGWFPVGCELTSGVPDAKEGYYFGEELPTDDPRVSAGLPLHGPNLFPQRPTELGPIVLAWMDEMHGLAQRLMEAVAVGLGLARDHFSGGLTAEPTELFRMFHYPPAPRGSKWGVAEHTDYGLLTILAQDSTGGLEAMTPDGRWVPVPPDRDVLVGNLGDMLERLTGGVYRSTPHRVRPSAPGTSRLSFPYFFDPGWNSRPARLNLGEAARAHSRWDGENPLLFEGTYGEYLMSRVARVFPHLFDESIGQ